MRFGELREPSGRREGDQGKVEVRDKFMNQEMFNAQNQRGNTEVLANWMSTSNSLPFDQALGLVKWIRIHFIMQWVITITNAREDLRRTISIPSTKRL